MTNWIKLRTGTNIVDVVSREVPHKNKIDTFIEVPFEVFGGDTWDGTVITRSEVKVSTDPRDYPLTPRNFNWMAARFGYNKAIDSVLAVLEASDIDAYAEVSGDVLGAKTFRFQKVLEVVNDPRLKRFIPAGVDTSEGELTRVWMIAKDRKL